MEDIITIVNDYEKELNILQSKYHSKCICHIKDDFKFSIESFCKDFIKPINDITKMNCLDRYLQIFDKCINIVDDILKDILQESLSHEYQKVMKIQNDFIELLGIQHYNNVAIVNVSMINNYFERICKLDRSIDILYKHSVSPLLNKLRDIHIKQDSLFVKTQDTICKEDEIFDSKFITMTNIDIDKHNDIVRQHATEDKKRSIYTLNV